MIKFNYMKHPYNKQKTSAVWDYDIRTADFSDPWVIRWYLARRINWGDWKGLRKRDILKHLPRLAITDGMKKFLKAALT